MSEQKDYVKELVEANGDSVGMNQPVCLIWRTDHEDCTGCPSALGCSKMAKIRLVTTIPMFYQPNSFKDFQKMSDRIDKLMEMVLNAKTPDEVKKVPGR